MENKTKSGSTIINWISSSVTLKLVVITILALLLLIPAMMITSIIREREEMKQFAVQEVTTMWAGQQQITGPVLSIPVILEYVDQNYVTRQTIEYWHILPSTLNIEGEIDPSELNRGIYEIVVYTSNLSFEGQFNHQDELTRQHLKEIQYDNAFLTIGISDLRGIRDQVTIQWNNNELEVEPGTIIPELIPSGFTVHLPDAPDILNETFNFNFELKLKGSENISFVPIGSTTYVQIESVWPSPSFNGNFLPDQRQVTEAGFNAQWKILQLNRNFAQNWVGNLKPETFSAAAFGLKLLYPVDNYQKSMRSAKYAILAIALTFLIFFLVEVLNKRKIHPFQYTLVGLALCLFYILLVSITEHFSFRFAYAVSTLAIVAMIGLYSIKVFRKRRLTFMLILALLGIYGFIYIIIQLTDYALLMGSLGLTAILALTMYLTRNVDWYQLRMEGPQNTKFEQSK